MDPTYRKSEVPEGRSGPWAVEQFQVGPVPSARPDERPACFRTPPGTYTRLKRGNEVFMTDVYDEWWTQRAALDEARQRGGRVLITGLGLGLVAACLLEPPESPVEHVTIIEASGDVIRLVAPHLNDRFGNQIAIEHADAYTWAPPAGAHFSVGWHDIWPNPYPPEVTEEMARLEMRYAPYCDWQGSWPRAVHRAAGMTNA